MAIPWVLLAKRWTNPVVDTIASCKLMASDYFLDHLGVNPRPVECLALSTFSSSLWLLCEGAKETEIQPVRA